MIFNSTVINDASGLFASIRVYVPSGTYSVKATYQDHEVGEKTVVGKFVHKQNPVVVPDGYTQLEYIASTGTQYIDTGFVPTLNTKVEFKISSSSTQPNTYPQLFGVQQLEDGTNRFGITSDWTAKTGSTGMAASTVVRDIPREGSLEYNKYVLDGVTYTATGSWTPANASLYLFSGNSADGRFNGTVMLYSVAKFYYFKMYDSGTLVRDFVPAKRNSDGVVGLYDIVTNTFFNNSGTGAFTAGTETPQTIEYFLIDKITDLGTWKVIATDGENTSTKDILVDAAIEYEIDVVYILWLYREGDECEDVTGGWGTTNLKGASAPAVVARWPLFQKNDTNMFVSTNGQSGGGGTLNTISKVDLTGFSKVIFEGTLTNNMNPGYSKFIVWDQLGSTLWTENMKEYAQPVATGTTTRLEIDVSSLSGSYVVGFGLYGQNGGSERVDITVDRIWVE